MHAPAQVPTHYTDTYNTSIADPKRRTFAGMLSAVDEGITNVSKALAAKQQTANTLWVFTADKYVSLQVLLLLRFPSCCSLLIVLVCSGGPTTTGDGVGARNWPLRGGKHSIWDGGVRATAFISGVGIAPSSSASNMFRGLMHGADWLPTLSSVAGYDLKVSALSPPAPPCCCSCCRSYC